MRIKKPKNEMIEEDIKHFADSLNLSVEDLHSTKVSLADIISVLQDERTMKTFDSARAVFTSTTFFTVKYLVNTNAVREKEDDISRSSNPVWVADSQYNPTSVSEGQILKKDVSEDDHSAP